MRSRRIITLAITLAASLLSVATAGASLHRTVKGPAGVVPGHVYTFYVSGFRPGELIYPTVQPLFCAGSYLGERCLQDPCPGCAPTKIGSSGTATVRFRWPKKSYYVVANMHFAHYKWRQGTGALVSINVASTGVPRGCRREPSITANPQAGSVVCAATLTRIR
jgi:hypothetical protein